MMSETPNRLSASAYHLLTQIIPGERVSSEFPRTCARKQLEDLKECIAEMLQMIPEAEKKGLCLGIHKETAVWEFISENPEPVLNELVSKNKLKQDTDGIFVRPLKK